jgi:hypothetical protein
MKNKKWVFLCALVFLAPMFMSALNVSLPIESQAGAVSVDEYDIDLEQMRLNMSVYTDIYDANE